MPTVNYTVGANGDDGGFDAAALRNDESANRIDIGNADYPGVRHGWFRWTGVTIPVGATIDSAYITYQANGSGWGDGAAVRFYGVDTDNPAAPTTFAQASGATLTTAYVNWSISDWSWTDNADYTSPTLAAIIQELVDSYSFASGSALMIQVRNNSSPDGYYRGVAAYEHTSAYAARLQITYTAGGGGAGAPVPSSNQKKNKHLFVR
jgi:hypothetical protein